MSEQPPNDPNAQQPPQPLPHQPAWQPPPPQYGAPYVPPPGYQPPLPTPTIATAALVLGIAGLTMCPFILSIPAWIVGRNAVKEIDASQGRLGGRSMASAGYILGIVGTFVWLLFILAVVLLFLAFPSECSGTTTDDTFSFRCS